MAYLGRHDAPPPVGHLTQKQARARVASDKSHSARGRSTTVSHRASTEEGVGGSWAAEGAARGGVSERQEMSMEP